MVASLGGLAWLPVASRALVALGTYLSYRIVQGRNLRFEMHQAMK